MAELIHARISYRPEHWIRVGTFNRPVIGDGEVNRLRQRHLRTLRGTKGFEDYGDGC
ncbi:hypothetical protein [Endothiovibrio diazotrophicus]